MGVLDTGRHYSAVSLIESSFGKSAPDQPGALELTAASDGALFHFWRDSKTLAWSGPAAVPLD